MNELDSLPFKIKCPKCGKQINKTVRWAKGIKPTCPHCGGGFETSQFRRSIREAEQALADFKRNISKTIKLNIKF